MRGRLGFAVSVAVILAGMAVWFRHDVPAKKSPPVRERTGPSPLSDAAIEYLSSGASSKPSEDGTVSSGRAQAGRSSEQGFPHYDTLEEARFRLGRLNEEIRDTVDGPTRLQIEEARHLRNELRRLKMPAVPPGEAVDLRSLREEWLQEEHPAVPDALKHDGYLQ